MRRSSQLRGGQTAAPKLAGRQDTRAATSQVMDDGAAPPNDHPMDDEAPTDGSFASRFSATRLHSIGHKLLEDHVDKWAVISRGCFGSLLNIGSFTVPGDFMDWLIMKIDPDRSMFSHKLKTIHFTRDMVHKNFDIPSGSRPVELLKRNEPHELRNIYRSGNRAPIKRCISVLHEASNNDSVTIERSWVLLLLGLVLTPGTGNMIPLEYLPSLVDMDQLNQFAWDEHVLAVAMKEVKKYQQKREAGLGGFWIGGCLPMFAVIYMDFLDIPRTLAGVHTFNRTLPRACFVSTNDFKIAAELDRNKLALHKVEFGKRNLRLLSETPYATEGPRIDVDGQKQQHGSGASIPNAPSSSNAAVNDVGGDVCGSLDEWLHPLPSSVDLEIPEHMQHIYEKHKNLYAVEMKSTLNSVGKVLQSMFCKRLGELLVEVHSSKSSNKEDEGRGDVTFVVGGSNAASAPDTSASAQQDELERQVAAGPKMPTVEGAGDTALKQGQSCAQVGKGFVDLEKEVEQEDAQREVAREGGADATPDVNCGKDVQGVAAKAGTVILSQGTVKAMEAATMEWDDGPSCDLFPVGSEDYEWLNQQVPPKCSKSPDAVATPSAVQQTGSAGPTFDNTPEIARDNVNRILHPIATHISAPLFDTDPKIPRPNEINKPIFDASPIATAAPFSIGSSGNSTISGVATTNVDSSSGPSCHIKKSVKKKKRTAQSPNGVLKMKNIKVDAARDALHQQYVMSRYKLRKPKDGEALPAFIEIGSFHTSLHNFHASLKPRAEIDNEVMALYLKTFNLEQMGSREKPKKFAFSVFMSVQLAAEPDAFDPKLCEREFRMACVNNNISNSDLLFFTVVQKRHWVVVVANLSMKQFNVFDPIKNSKDVQLLHKATNNMITYLKRVARSEPTFKHDLDSFEVFNPVYPRQGTYYDCGFFVILYLENFDGVVMTSFDQEYIPKLQMRIASDLLRHPGNKLDPAEQLKKMMHQKGGRS